MKDFFISYNRADKQWAEWIAWELEEARYSVYIQAWDFRAGGNFVLDMQQAAADSYKTIAVISESYLKSSFTQPEWAAAFAQDPESLERKLIPVRVQNCQPEGMMRPIVYVDLVGLTEAEAKQALLDSLKERAKPEQAPPFPGVRSTERVIETPKVFPGIKQKVKENVLQGWLESLESDFDCQQAIARIYYGNKLVGKGCLVSSRYLLTSAHVVIEALGLNRETENLSETPQGKFPINFSNSDAETQLSRIGKVIIWNPCPNFFANQSLARACLTEDIALVELDQVCSSEIANLILQKFENNGSPLFSETNQETSIVRAIISEVWLKQGQLIENLTDCDWKWIKRAYDHCRPRDWNSKQPGNLAEMVTDLYRYDEKNKNQENILINFAAYLVAQSELSENLKVDLRRWAKRAFGVTEGEIAEQCDRLKESLAVQQVSEKANIESRLWIILTEAGTSDQYKLESAYYIKDINNYQRDNKNSYQKVEFELSENIKRSQLQDRDFCVPGLTEIIEQIYVDTTLRIDFFLPFKSLDLIADSWLIRDEYGDEPFPIGSEYPVVIRVLDRHNKPYKQAPLWESNWKPQYINQLSKSALICSDSPLVKISEEIAKEEVLGLRCKCPIENHKTHKNKLKPMIMRRGLPIALWLRQELKKCCGEENYHELLDINLVELPQKLKNIRNADRQNESHLAHHISLLWDDPITLPSDDYKFQMPKPGL